MSGPGHVKDVREYLGYEGCEHLSVSEVARLSTAQSLMRIANFFDDDDGLFPDILFHARSILDMTRTSIRRAGGKHSDE
jgi:hypothetical protein